MHIQGVAETKSAWDQSLIDCGRRLLVSHALEQCEHHADYELAEIATVCLSDSGSAPDAECLCRRISDATRNGQTSWRNLERLIKTLFASHPLTALDCWLTDSQEDWRHRMLFFHAIDDHNPLDAVPVPLLLEWADADPNTRFPRLAGIVPAFKRQDDATEWSEHALALLNAGPDRAAVLRGLATQLHPSGWSGSLADILERRRLLLRPFLDDDDPAVRQVARETDDRLQREIASERLREVNRDERFE